MRTLNAIEIGMVSGGESAWTAFWNSVGNFLAGLFASPTSGLQAAVQLCTSQGGTANYIVNGSSYSVNVSGGAGVPVEGEPVPITLSLDGSTSTVVGNYTVICQGASGSGGHTTSPGAQ